jgi:hypothetical protein
MESPHAWKQSLHLNMTKVIEKWNSRKLYLFLFKINWVILMCEILTLVRIIYIFMYIVGAVHVLN